MASSSLCIFFQNDQQNVLVTWFDHRELWIEKVFDETFSVGNFYFIFGNNVTKFVDFV